MLFKSHLWNWNFVQSACSKVAVQMDLFRPLKKNKFYPNQYCRWSIIWVSILFQLDLHIWKALYKNFHFQFQQKNRHKDRSHKEKNHERSSDHFNDEVSLLRTEGDRQSCSTNGMQYITGTYKEEFLWSCKLRDFSHVFHIKLNKRNKVLAWYNLSHE